MPKAHPIELRTRVVQHVETGHSHRSTALHFKVSVKFVNDMVKLKRERGSLEPKRQGGYKKSKLLGVSDWLVEQISLHKGITLSELRESLAQTHKIHVQISTLHDGLRRLNLSYKKNSPRLGTRPE